MYAFLPLYFVYGEIVPREFGPMETLSSWIYLLVFAVLPVYAAYKKKFWMSAGLAVYGIVAAFPVWVLPGMADKLAGEDASIVSVVWAFFLSRSTEWQRLLSLRYREFSGIPLQRLLPEGLCRLLLSFTWDARCSGSTGMLTGRSS